MQIRTTCSRDCGDACGMIATVEDGRVVRLQGDPEHPVTRGFLCERTNRDFPERLTDPERLTAPLRRKGSGFEEIGWEEALDLVAQKMLHIRGQSGPEAILRYRCGGSLGVLKAVTSAFFDAFGPVTTTRGDICAGAGDEAQERDFGAAEANDLFELRHAATIVVWGRNVYTSAVHQIPLLKEARKRGARIVLIDPVRHRTAELCATVLQPRPGTDFHLAMAVSRRLLDRGQWHAEAASWCAGLDGYRALVESRSAEEWWAATGLAPEDLEVLAESWAPGPEQAPLSILLGWGLQRRANGGGSVRAIDALAAVTGQIGVPGAGVSFYCGRRTPFELDFRPPAAGGGGADADASDPAAPAPPAEARTLLDPLLADELSAAADPPIRMVWIDLANPVAMLPGSRRLAEALRSREFVVVVDSFLTDTAQCADLVLPCATMLEDDDLCGAYGHHWLGEQRAVVPPPEGVKTDLQIVRELAPRVGLGDHFDRSAEEWKVEALRRIAPQGASLEELREGAVRNPEAEQVVFPGRRFRTEDGKAQLLADAPPEIPEVDADWPLYLTAISVPGSQASQAAAMGEPGRPEARAHPSMANGIPDRAPAKVVSPHGELEVVLLHDDRLHPTVLHLPKGGWMSAGRCANTLIAPKATDIGGGACYYDERVRIEAV